MYEVVAGGGKLDIKRFREFCAEFNMKDEDVDNMFTVSWLTFLYACQFQNSNSLF